MLWVCDVCCINDGSDVDVSEKVFRGSEKERGGCKRKGGGFK